MYFCPILTFHSYFQLNNTHRSGGMERAETTNNKYLHFYKTFIESKQNTTHSL